MLQEFFCSLQQNQFHQQHMFSLVILSSTELQFEHIIQDQKSQVYMAHQEFHLSLKQVDLQDTKGWCLLQCKQQLVICQMYEPELGQFQYKFHFHHFNILLSNGMQKDLKYKLLNYQNDIHHHIQLLKQEHYLKNNFQNHQNAFHLSKQQV